MSKADPFAARAARRAAGKAGSTLPNQQSGLPSVPSAVTGSTDAQDTIAFAQGRAEKMMTFDDLPDPVETPDASGDLSHEEEQVLDLCMRGIKQFENAWWVMGKALANINARRLYRKTHNTFEDFCRDVLNKSRPTAYEEMTSYPIGELLSARADKSFEAQSNGMSARADTTIGKKAAAALSSITQDYGAEVSVAFVETVQDAAGKKVPVKAITGLVQQLPRRQDHELTPEELLARARQLVTKAMNPEGESEGAGFAGVSPALACLRDAVSDLRAAYQKLTPAKVKQALADAPEEAAELLTEAERAAIRVSNRVRP
ncbi:hypothetical protein [Streptomyces sp. NPDC002133]|uniref:hypothetical protein n=1 Tax=Streptomyces sp. NPDC002133 TaxID=3154409 RepID=UPI00333264BA